MKSQQYIWDLEKLCQETIHPEYYILLKYRFKNILQLICLFLFAKDGHLPISKYDSYTLTNN